MSSFQVNTSKIRKSSDHVSRLSGTLKRIESELDHVLGSLSISSGAAAEIKQSLRKKMEQVDTEQQKLEVMASALEDIAGIYERTERKILLNDTEIRKQLQNLSEEIKRAEKEYGMCHSGAYSIDPVNLCNGNYVYENTFLEIDAAIPLTFHVFYNSMNERRGSLGRGWMHDYEVRLEMESELIRVFREDASEWRFYKKDENTFYSLNGTFGLLKKTENGYVMRDRTQTEYYFDAFGTLIRKKDLSGAVLRMTYGDDGRLKEVSDDFQNRLLFAYDMEGRLADVSDHAGRTICISYQGENICQVSYGENRVIQYHYDESGYLAEIVNARGITGLRNVFDTEGRTLSQSFPDGGVMSYRYEGKSVILTEQNGNEIEYVHDEYDRNVQNIYADGTESFTYNEHNQRESFTDKRGNTSCYEYDDQGCLTGFVNARGDRMTLAYTEWNQLQSVSINGKTLHRAVFNDKHRQTETVNADGTHCCYQYDESGHLTGCIREDGSIYKMEYDAFGDMISMTNSMGGKVSYEYDKLHRVIRTVDALGNCTDYTYNEADELVSVRNAAGNVCRYFYDACGNLVRSEDYNGAITEASYNAMNKPVKYVDAEGNVTSWEYDNMWNVSKKTTPDGAETTFSYNMLHHLETITDANGKKTYFTYDSCGNMTTRTDAEGSTYRIGYDELNRPNHVTDPCGREASAEYDEFGNVTKVIHPDGSEESYRYDLMGRCIYAKATDGYEKYYHYNAIGKIETVYDHDGMLLQYEYYPGGLLKSERSHDGNFRFYEYDVNENVTALVNQDGSRLTFIYDCMGQITEVSQDGNRLESYEYDAVGNIVSVMDGEGNRRNYHYSKTGDMIEVKDANGTRTQYEYDGNHRLIRIIQPEWKAFDAESIRDFNDSQKKYRVTSYERDFMGNIIKVLDPHGNEEKYSYDGCNRLAGRIDADGNSVFCEYYPDGTEKSYVFSDGRSVKMRYNALKQLIELEDWLGTIAVLRDQAGRPMEVTDASGDMVSYEWGRRGEKKCIKYPDGTRISYKYDEASRLISCEYGDKMVGYGYYDNGKLKEKIYPNQYYTKYFYDSRGKLRELCHVKDEKILDRFRYSYDKNGRKSMIEHQCEDQVMSGIYGYQYDEIGNLLITTKDGQVEERFAYDSFGNRVQSWKGGTSTEYKYNSLNQLIFMKDKEGEHSFSYDRRGNLREEKVNGISRMHLTFGCMGYLTGVSTGTEDIFYEYNGFGQRVKERRSLLSGAQQEVSCIYDISRDHHNLLVRRENGLERDVFWDGELLGFCESGKETFLMNDERMTPVRRLDQFGDTGLNVCNAFGNICKDKAEKSFWGFTGYETDEVPGLYFANQREYVPKLGRFISKDAVRGSIAVPLTLNAYVYCMNDPINYTDPTGAIVAWLAGGIVGAVGNVVVKFAGDVVNSVGAGEWKGSSWQSYVGSATGGFVSGTAFVMSGGNMAIAGAAGSATENFVTGGLGMLTGAQGYTAEDGYTWRNLLGSTVSSGVTGAVSGFAFGNVGKYVKIQGINAGRGSFQAVWKQVMTKAARGQIANVTMKTMMKGLVAYGGVQFFDKLIGKSIDYVKDYFKNGAKNVLEDLWNNLVSEARYSNAARASAYIGNGSDARCAVS